MNLGFGQVEVGLVGVVEIGDIFVGNADAGSGFFGQQFLYAQIAAELGLQILHGHFAFVELLLKLLLRVGGFEFRELRVDSESVAIRPLCSARCSMISLSMSVRRTSRRWMAT